MFWRRREALLAQRCETLEKRINSLMAERDILLDDVNEARAENKKLSAKRRIEEEEIAHKIKMREETVDLNYEKKLAKVEGAKDKAIAKVKDEYRDKTEKQLEKRGDELKKMYTEILGRLPDVSLAIEQRSEKTS